MQLHTIEVVVNGMVKLMYVDVNVIQVILSTLFTYLHHTQNNVKHKINFTITFTPMKLHILLLGCIKKGHHIYSIIIIGSLQLCRVNISRW